MKIKCGPPLMEALDLVYRANRPALLEGTHGVGKSEIVKDTAERLRIGYIVRDLSLMEPPDLVGLPTHKDGRTSYAPPDFLPREGKGFLMLEELNRSEKYMMGPCLQLLTERRLNDYQLPDGWLPIAAINPSAEGYAVQELDPALRSRFVTLEVEPDVRLWLEWAKANNIHRAVQQYVARAPDIFDTTNPRSWAYVSSLLQAAPGGRDAARNLLLPTVAGLVGDAHARALLKTWGGNDGALVTTDAVLGRYRAVQARIREWKAAKNTAELKAIAHAVQISLQSSEMCDNMRDNNRMQKNLEAFIGDLPADIGRKVRAMAEERGVL